MDDAQTPNLDAFGPTASLETLQLRAKVLTELRSVFAQNGYWEVDTPSLCHETVVDAHLNPFAVTTASGEEMFLQTSPELAMKRLLAAGAEAIYQITHAFRDGESGQHHNPEFTIVEWYRRNTTYQDQMELTEQLVTAAAKLIQSDRSRPSTDPAFGAFNELAGSFERLSYDAAFLRHAGTAVLSLSAPQLAQLAEAHHVSVPDSLRTDDRDEWLNLLLTELVEPRLGHDRPIFLFDYPASQSALAHVRAGDPPVAERFELYIRGVEICNGYQELTDASILQERCREQAELRRESGRRRLPSPVRFIAAHRAGLPSCSGVALGLERLLMVLIGAQSIAEVTAFPFDRA